MALPVLLSVLLPVLPVLSGLPGLPGCFSVPTVPATAEATTKTTATEEWVVEKLPGHCIVVRDRLLKEIVHRQLWDVLVAKGIVFCRVVL